MSSDVTGILRTKSPQKLLRVFSIMVLMATMLMAAPQPGKASHTDPADPNDPLIQGCETVGEIGGCMLWGIKQVRAEGAWHTTRGGGAVVAVVDSGIDLDHEDLAANTVAGNTFLTNCPDLDAGCGNGDWQSGPSGSPTPSEHGTHVAGTIGAVRNNAKGVVGVAPETKLLAVKVSTSGSLPCFQAAFDNIARGIRWAADNGADVINMSLGHPVPVASQACQELFTTIHDAVEYANTKGVVTVSAAGNEGFIMCSGPPGSAPGGICVAATDRRQAKAAYSNLPIRPDLVTVSAPGGSILPFCADDVVSTVPPGTGTTTCGKPSNGAYEEFAGTSMASPHVAGAAALLKSMGCTRQQTIDLLTGNARQPFTDTRGVWTPAYGHGIIDAQASVNAAASICEPDTNTPPVAGADSGSGAEDNSITINALANDVDADGDVLSIESVNAGSNGTVVNNGDGTITYTPKPDFNGTDSFTYRVSDGAASTTGVVSVVLTPVDDGPRAVRDSGFFSGSSITVNVKANDVDPEGDPFTITSVSAASNGTAIANADGFTYTPSPGFNGADAVIYTIANAGGTSTGRASLFGSSCLSNHFDNVEGLPPVAEDGNGNQIGGDANNPFSRGWVDDLAQNDSPVTTTWYPHKDAQAKSFSQSWFTDAVGPNGKDDRLVSPEKLITPSTKLSFWHRHLFEKDPFSGDNFDGAVLEVTSNGGQTWTDVISAGGVWVSGGYNGTIQTGFGSPIPGRSAWTGTSSTSAYPTPPTSMVKVEVDLGALAGKAIRARWRLALDDISFSPGTAWYVDDITFTGQLGQACIDAANAIVPPVNRLPVANDDQLFLNQDNPATAFVLQNDSDPDNDPLTIVGVVQPLHGTVSNSGTSLTYTPNPGYIGTDAFSYTIADGVTGSDSANVAVDVNGRPTANDDSASTTASQNVTIPVLANDTDPDGDPMIVTSFTQPANGTTQCSPTECIYDPSGSFGGTDAFSYTACDARAACDSASVAVTIDADTQPPSPPSIDTPANGELVGYNQFMAGWSEAGATVKVYEGATLVRQFVAGATGLWQSNYEHFFNDGLHTIRATATDSAGNTSGLSSPVTFEVDGTAPSVNLNTPSDMQMFLGGESVSVVGTASDNRGVAKIRVQYVDVLTGATVRNVFATCSTCGPTSTQVGWSDSPEGIHEFGSMPPGWYYVAAISYDAFGNQSTAKAVRFIRIP